MMDGIDCHYWEEREWRKFITPDDLPELKHWTPGTDLPLVHQTNHLRPTHIRRGATVGARVLSADAGLASARFV